MESLKNKLLNCSLDKYDDFFEFLFAIQKERFGDTLWNMRYKGERPILPTYQITLVQKEYFREDKDCYLC